MDEGHTRPYLASFYLILPFQLSWHHIGNIKVANDGIRTAEAPALPTEPQPLPWAFNLAPECNFEKFLIGVISF